MMMMMMMIVVMLMMILVQVPRPCGKQPGDDDDDDDCGDANDDIYSRFPGLVANSRGMGTFCAIDLDTGARRER